MWRWAEAVAILALTLPAPPALAALDADAARRESQAAIGRQVGDFVLTDTQGREVRLSSYRGKPLVKEGGTMIICHPLRDEFHPEHHPSYIEFFHRCLAHGTDGAELGRMFEQEFARNPTYIHMYRYGHAYHGTHPFFMWYWGEPAREHLGRVIAAGCEEPEVAARMGWEAADTLDEAIAYARREGLAYTVAMPHDKRRRPKSYADNFRYNRPA